jgi:hypothetical protein
VSTSLEKLHPQPVLQTMHRLQERIGARFPGRGLHQVAGELVTLAEEVADSPVTSRGRLHAVRLASRVLMVVVLLATAFLFFSAVRDAVRDGPDHGFEWLPLIENAVNDLVFASIAVWFLNSAPERIQRAQSLALLHRMRSLAHIVDMHQLTKDPERLRASFRPTEKSADPMGLTPDELEHYLDYCSELLSLISKTAALCAEESRDAVVLDTVSTIETLTVGMSRKIWQKIAVLTEARGELP